MRGGGGGAPVRADAGRGLQGPGPDAQAAAGLCQRSIKPRRGNMSLSDREILELNELCNALADGTITASQKDLLASRLAASEEARRFYIRVMGLCASLHYYASEMQSEAADALP